MPFKSVRRLQLSIRMNQHFRITLHSLIKLLICIRCAFNINLMGDNKRGFRASGYDQIAKITVIGLDVTLASTDRETLKAEIRSTSLQHR